MWEHLAPKLAQCGQQGFARTPLKPKNVGNRISACHIESEKLARDDTSLAPSWAQGPLFGSQVGEKRLCLAEAEPEIQVIAHGSASRLEHTAILLFGDSFTPSWGHRGHMGKLFQTMYRQERFISIPLKTSLLKVWDWARYVPFLAEIALTRVQIGAILGPSWGQVVPSRARGSKQTMDFGPI